MGNMPPGMGGEGTPPGGDSSRNSNKDNKDNEDKKKKKRFEPRASARSNGRRSRRRKGPTGLSKTPTVTPSSKCKLRMLKLDRVKDFLLLEQEFIRNQHQQQQQQPSSTSTDPTNATPATTNTNSNNSNNNTNNTAAERDQEEREKLDELRGTPLGVGTLEELIDDNHCIVSSSVGPEYYVNILSSVNQDLLEPGCSILFHNKTMSVVGILTDDTDPSECIYIYVWCGLVWLCVACACVPSLLFFFHFDWVVVF
jgi:26S proteasome regulatory subunit T2